MSTLLIVRISRCLNFQQTIKSRPGYLKHFSPAATHMVYGKEATIRYPTGHGTMILPWVMPVAQLWHLLLATVLRVFHFPRLWKGTCLLQQTVPVASNGKTGRNLDLASRQISSNFKIVLVLVRCSSLFIMFDRANETETAQTLGDTATSYDPS